MYIGLYVKYRLLRSDGNETGIFWTNSSKNGQMSNFDENPSSGSRVVPFGRTDRRTDMTKLIVFFANTRRLLKSSRTLLVVTYYNFPIVVPG